MAFHFSAMQFDRRFRAEGLNNWEYPRYSPPRPRDFQQNTKIICDKDGHLLPGAKREGNPFGHYLGTYELPLRITRSFVFRYDACLTRRYRFRDFPRDLCGCCRERHECDQRNTLGLPGDKYWAKPQCPKKCDGIKKIAELDERARKCKRLRCTLPKAGTAGGEKLIKPPKDTVRRSEANKRNRKRQVTAFGKFDPAMAAAKKKMNMDGRGKV